MSFEHWERFVKDQTGERYIPPGMKTARGRNKDNGKPRHRKIQTVSAKSEVESDCNEADAD